MTDKGLPIKANLIDDLLFHTKQIPLACFMYNRFSHISTLNIHLHVHTKDKPLTSNHNHL